MSANTLWTLLILNISDVAFGYFGFIGGFSNGLESYLPQQFSLATSLLQTYNNYGNNLEGGVSHFGTGLAPPSTLLRDGQMPQYSYISTLGVNYWQRADLPYATLQQNLHSSNNVVLYNYPTFYLQTVYDMRRWVPYVIKFTKDITPVSLRVPLLINYFAGLREKYKLLKQKIYLHDPRIFHDISQQKVAYNMPLFYYELYGLPFPSYGILKTKDMEEYDLLRIIINYRNYEFFKLLPSKYLDTINQIYEHNCQLFLQEIYGSVWKILCERYIPLLSGSFHKKIGQRYNDILRPPIYYGHHVKHVTYTHPEIPSSQDLHGISESWRFYNPYITHGIEPKLIPVPDSTYYNLLDKHVLNNQLFLKEIQKRYTSFINKFLGLYLKFAFNRLPLVNIVSSQDNILSTHGIYGAYISPSPEFIEPKVPLQIPIVDYNEQYENGFHYSEPINHILTFRWPIYFPKPLKTHNYDQNFSPDIRINVPSEIQIVDGQPVYRKPDQNDIFHYQWPFTISELQNYKVQFVSQPMLHPVISKITDQIMHNKPMNTDSLILKDILRHHKPIFTPELDEIYRTSRYNQQSKELTWPSTLFDNQESDVIYNFQQQEPEIIPDYNLQQQQEPEIIPAYNLQQQQEPEIIPAYNLQQQQEPEIIPSYNLQQQQEPEIIPAYNLQQQQEPEIIPAYNLQQQQEPEIIPAYNLQQQQKPEIIPAYNLQQQQEPEIIPDYNLQQQKEPEIIPAYKFQQQQEPEIIPDYKFQQQGPKIIHNFPTQFASEKNKIPAETSYIEKTEIYSNADLQSSQKGYKNSKLYTDPTEYVHHKQPFLQRDNGVNELNEMVHNIKNYKIPPSMHESHKEHALLNTSDTPKLFNYYHPELSHEMDENQLLNKEEEPTDIFFLPTHKDDSYKYQNEPTQITPSNIYRAQSEDNFEQSEYDLEYDVNETSQDYHLKTKNSHSVEGEGYLTPVMQTEYILPDVDNVYQDNQYELPSPHYEQGFPFLYEPEGFHEDSKPYDIPDFTHIVQAPEVQLEEDVDNARRIPSGYMIPDDQRILQKNEYSTPDIYDEKESASFKLTEYNTADSYKKYETNTVKQNVEPIIIEDKKIIVVNNNNIITNNETSIVSDHEEMPIPQTAESPTTLKQLLPKKIENIEQSPPVYFKPGIQERTEKPAISHTTEKSLFIEPKSIEDKKMEFIVGSKPEENVPELHTELGILPNPTLIPHLYPLEHSMNKRNKTDESPLAEKLSIIVSHENKSPIAEDITPIMEGMQNPIIEEKTGEIMIPDIMESEHIKTDKPITIPDFIQAFSAELANPHYLDAGQFGNITFHSTNDTVYNSNLKITIQPPKTTSETASLAAQSVTSQPSNITVEPVSEIILHSNATIQAVKLQQPVTIQVPKDVIMEKVNHPANFESIKVQPINTENNIHVSPESFTNSIQSDSFTEQPLNNPANLIEKFVNFTVEVDGTIQPINITVTPDDFTTQHNKFSAQQSTDDGIQSVNKTLQPNGVTLQPESVTIQSVNDTVNMIDNTAQSVNTTLQPIITETVESFHSMLEPEISTFLPFSLIDKPENGIVLTDDIKIQFDNAGTEKQIFTAQHPSVEMDEIVPFGTEKPIIPFSIPPLHKETLKAKISPARNLLIDESSTSQIVSPTMLSKLDVMQGKLSTFNIPTPMPQESVQSASQEKSFIIQTEYLNNKRLESVLDTGPETVGEQKPKRITQPLIFNSRNTLHEPILEMTSVPEELANTFNPFEMEKNEYIPTNYFKPEDIETVTEVPTLKENIFPKYEVPMITSIGKPTTEESLITEEKTEYILTLSEKPIDKPSDIEKSFGIEYINNEEVNNFINSILDNKSFVHEQMDSFIDEPTEQVEDTTFQIKNMNLREPFIEEVPVNYSDIQGIEPTVYEPASLIESKSFKDKKSDLAVKIGHDDGKGKEDDITEPTNSAHRTSVYPLSTEPENLTTTKSIHYFPKIPGITNHSKPIIVENVKPLVLDSSQSTIPKTIKHIEFETTPSSMLVTTQATVIDKLHPMTPQSMSDKILDGKMPIIHENTYVMDSTSFNKKRVESAIELDPEIIEDNHLLQPYLQFAPKSIVSTPKSFEGEPILFNYNQKVSFLKQRDTTTDENVYSIKPIIHETSKSTYFETTSNLLDYKLNSVNPSPSLHVISSNNKPIIQDSLIADFAKLNTDNSIFINSGNSMISTPVTPAIDHKKISPIKPFNTDHPKFNDDGYFMPKSLETVKPAVFESSDPTFQKKSTIIESQSLINKKDQSFMDTGPTSVNNPDSSDSVTLEVTIPTISENIEPIATHMMKSENFLSKEPVIVDLPGSTSTEYFDIIFTTSQPVKFTHTQPEKSNQRFINDDDMPYLRQEFMPIKHVITEPENPEIQEKLFAIDSELFSNSKLQNVIDPSEEIKEEYIPEDHVVLEASKPNIPVISKSTTIHTEAFLKPLQINLVGVNRTEPIIGVNSKFSSVEPENIEPELFKPFKPDNSTKTEDTIVQHTNKFVPLPIQTAVSDFSNEVTTETSIVETRKPILQKKSQLVKSDSIRNVNTESMVDVPRERKEYPFQSYENLQQEAFNPGIVNPKNSEIPSAVHIIPTTEIYNKSRQISNEHTRLNFDTSKPFVSIESVKPALPHLVKSEIITEPKHGIQEDLPPEEHIIIEQTTPINEERSYITESEIFNGKKIETVQYESPIRDKETTYTKPDVSSSNPVEMHPLKHTISLPIKPDSVDQQKLILGQNIKSELISSESINPVTNEQLKSNMSEAVKPRTNKSFNHMIPSAHTYRVADDINSDYEENNTLELEEYKKYPIDNSPIENLHEKTIKMVESETNRYYTPQDKTVKLVDDNYEKVRPINSVTYEGDSLPTVIPEIIDDSKSIYMGEPSLPDDKDGLNIRTPVIQNNWFNSEPKPSSNNGHAYLVDKYSHNDSRNKYIDSIEPAALEKNDHTIVQSPVKPEILPKSETNILYSIVEPLNMSPMKPLKIQQTEDTLIDRVKPKVPQSVVKEPIKGNKPTIKEKIFLVESESFQKRKVKTTVDSDQSLQDDLNPPDFIDSVDIKPVNAIIRKPSHQASKHGIKSRDPNDESMKIIHGDGALEESGSFNSASLQENFSKEDNISDDQQIRFGDADEISPTSFEKPTVVDSELFGVRKVQNHFNPGREELDFVKSLEFMRDSETENKNSKYFDNTDTISPLIEKSENTHETDFKIKRDEKDLVSDKLPEENYFPRIPTKSHLDLENLHSDKLLDFPIAYKLGDNYFERDEMQEYDPEVLGTQLEENNNKFTLPEDRKQNPHTFPDEKIHTIAKINPYNNIGKTPLEYGLKTYDVGDTLSYLRHKPQDGKHFKDYDYIHDEELVGEDERSHGTKTMYDHDESLLTEVENVDSVTEMVPGSVSETKSNTETKPQNIYKKTPASQAQTFFGNDNLTNSVDSFKESNSKEEFGRYSTKTGYKDETLPFQDEKRNIKELRNYVHGFDKYGLGNVESFDIFHKEKSAPLDKMEYDPVIPHYKEKDMKSSFANENDNESRGKRLKFMQPYGIQEYDDNSAFGKAYKSTERKPLNSGEKSNSRNEKNKLKYSPFADKLSLDTEDIKPLSLGEKYDKEISSKIDFPHGKSLDFEKGRGKLPKDKFKLQLNKIKKDHTLVNVILS